jgi:Tfp pilus assembly protein FimT
MKSKRTAGFSVIEMVLVVGIALVVGAMAAPSVMSAVANMRLRSSASGVAGLLQNARMQAVKEDTFYTSRSTTLSGTQTLVAYVDLDNDQSYDSNEPTLQLPANTTFEFSGFPSTSSLGSPTTPTAFLPAFNARGLPCVAAGTVCNTITTPVAYFVRNARPFGAFGWAAVSITPAGRVRTWIWDGNAWR